MRRCRIFAALVAAALVIALPAPPSALAADRPVNASGPRPCVVIAHRGASAYLPEHTLEAYALAARMGADYIEPDLVMTRDGVLIARHDNLLDLTTDVAQRPEFAARRTKKSVDGKEVEGWFSEDFTLSEIKTLRAIERIPQVRPGNAMFDRRYPFPTLDEILTLRAELERETGRAIGVYPETKHPSYFQSLGLAMEHPLVETLKRHGLDGADAPVFIQSFEIANLKALDDMTEVALIQLLDTDGKPFDVQAQGGATTYDAMATAKGLQAIAAYADGVGPEKNHFVIPLDAEGRLDGDRASRFVADAHAAGLLVHPYTFRAENHFLPAQYRVEGPATVAGDGQGEIAAFLAAGIDGFFTDNPDVGAAACRALAASRR
ncbi:MAG: glycerophosphodiester phosphodiesterase [Rhodospirillales bacterium]|nr:glycerophosphodiester phosphodiesterase [Rhodospirillales bacterium]